MKSYPSDPRDWAKMPVVLTDSTLTVGGWQVMQRWETPLMERMALEVTVNGGAVLEIGFGMGIAAEAIMKCSCASYSAIEAHPEIAAQARRWGEQQRVPVKVFEGFWQDVVPSLVDRFDGVLFDTYPLSQDERSRNHFAFIPWAPKLLKPGGVFTYYSDETSDFRTEHLRLLLAHFEEVKLIKVTGLNPPADCEYWQESHMVVPVARKHL